MALHDDDKVIPREQFSAEEVAEDIMMYGFKNFDYNTWKTLDDSDKAEAFDELIALIASQKYDFNLSPSDNRLRHYHEIKDSLETTVTHWAEREIRTQPRYRLEKDE
jgi:hypothetical protein